MASDAFVILTLLPLTTGFSACCVGLGAGVGVGLGVDVGAGVVGLGSSFLIKPFASPFKYFKDSTANSSSFLNASVKFSPNKCPTSLKSCPYFSNKATISSILFSVNNLSASLYIFLSSNNSS